MISNLKKTGSIIDDFEISKLLALSVYMSSMTMLLKWGLNLVYRRGNSMIFKISCHEIHGPPTSAGPGPCGFDLGWSLVVI